MDMFANLKKIQEKLKTSQEKLKSIEVVGEGGAGIVKIKINGEFDVLGVDIDESIIKKEEKQVLESSIKAALNDAHQKVKEKTQEDMAKNFDLQDFKDVF